MNAGSPVQRHSFTDLNLLSLSLRLGSFSSDMLNWGYIEPRWWRNYLHMHSFYEVCYAFQGRGTFRIEEQVHQVQAGEVFIAQPGKPHEIISSQTEPLGIYFWSYTLIPPKELLSAGQGIDPFLQAFLAAPRCISTHTPAMQRTLELLTEEIVHKEAGYMQTIEALTTKLLLDTARAVVDSSSYSEFIQPPVKSQQEATVQTIVRYLHDNYGRAITVRDIAAEVHLSERHASRLFHKIMNVSIMEYLISLRMEVATQLLAERRLSIKEVALVCGYPDVRHFTTLFHRRIGTTPASFRQEGGTHHFTSGRHISL